MVESTVVVATVNLFAASAYRCRCAPHTRCTVSQWRKREGGRERGREGERERRRKEGRKDIKDERMKGRILRILRKEGY